MAVSYSALKPSVGNGIDQLSYNVVPAPVSTGTAVAPPAASTPANGISGGLGGGKNQNNNGEPRKGYETVERSQAEPWGPTQPYLQDILGQASSNFNNGVGTAYPDFSTEVGMGAGTQDAINQLRSLMNNPSAMTQEAESAVRSMLASDPRYSDVYDRAMGPSAAETYLSGIASGPTENPYFQQMLDQGSSRIADEVRAAYSAKGRYGSEDFTDALARGISEYQTPLQYAAYDADLNRQLQAAGMIDNARLSGTSLGLNALGAEDSRRLGAAGVASAFDQNKQGLAQALMQAGMVEDQYAQAQRDADTARFFWENGGAQQQALSNYLSTVGPVAGLGGTQTVQEPNRPFQRVLGTAATIAGAVAPFFASDIRLKEDIRRVGQTDSGLNVYTFRYKGDPVVHMGVMAQEVLEVNPAAVGVMDNGMLGVDYSQVT